MPIGITEQDVFQAADVLLAGGGRPTIDRVRKELGRGSPNTINPMLDAWWASLAQRLRGAQTPGMPPSLAKVCTHLYEEMRKEVATEAERLAAVQLQQAQEAQRQIEQAQAALAAEKAGVVATVEGLRTDLISVRETNQSLNRRNSTLESELEAARRAAADISLKLKETNETRERESKVSQTELERVREQWQGNETRWLKEIDHLRGDIKKVRTESERSQKALGAHVEELQQQLQIATSERAAFQAAAEEARSDLAKEREARVFAEGALTASQALIIKPHRARATKVLRGHRHR